MHMNHPIVMKAGRMAAVTLFAAAAGLGLHAQQDASTPKTQPVSDLRAQLLEPMNPFASVLASSGSSSSSSSSSSADAAETTPADTFTMSTSMQPPPRRRYGSPRYTDSMHNPDGSNKYTFDVGGGFTLPTGGTHSYYSTSYDIQAGVGRNFNKNFGVMIDFNWANFGMQSNLLNYQLALYNSLGAYDQNGDPLSSLGGSGHVWSFALDPIYNFYGGDRTGAYVTGGVGFYHKTSTFTIPAIGTYCDYYYGCYEYQANQPIDAYVSNAVGVNAGIGFTYKLSQFSGERLFAEARYIYTANQRRPYFDGYTGTSLSPTYFNAFPQNSAPTTFIPITFGIRF